MINSQFIEVGIGLVFVYLLMSIMVSAINEAIVSFRSHRGNELKEALTLALNDVHNKNWVELIYDHPLIDTLKKEEKRPPSYISSSAFATSLIEVISNEAIKDHYLITGENISYSTIPSTNSPLENFKEGLKKLKQSDSKILLQTFVTNANNDYDKLKLNIENWYNEYMDRVSGWYKKKTANRLRVIAILLTIIMNVDTIKVSTTLWTNAVLREAVVTTAENFTKENPTLPDSKKDTTLTQQIDYIKSVYTQTNLLNLPIGWGDQNKNIDLIRKEYNQNEKSWPVYIGNLFQIYWSEVTIKTALGWLFTAFAISFGAPFWFDMLNKLINLRSSGKPSNPKKDDTSSTNS